MFDIYKLKKESAELRGKEEGIAENKQETAKNMLKEKYNIEEDDFMEILTERQLKMWLNGVYVLNVPQKELEDKCKRLFIHNK